MSEQSPRSGAPGHPELASLRSGQDWAAWLRQARPAQPFGNQWRRSGQAPARAWTALVHLARREGFAAALGDSAAAGARHPASYAQTGVSQAGQVPSSGADASGDAVTPESNTHGPRQVPRGQLASLQETAARFYRRRLPGSWALRYLASRGFGAAVQQRWQAGYAPAGWDTLTRHLRALGYRDSVIEAAGLAHRSWRGTLIDTFRDRAMFPIRDSAGTLVAFIGRASDGAASGVPKYLNTPRTRLYQKGEVLFGLWEGRDLLAMGSPPVIVEGPLDAIAVSTACAGDYVGVAPCGTALTSRQVAALAQLADLRAAGVLVAFDSDRAGCQAAVKAYRLLSTLTESATAVVLPAGTDPAQILRDQGADALAAAIREQAQPLADLVIDAEVDGWSRWLPAAEGQINALRAAAPLIAAMPSAQIARQVARLAHRLHLDYATVTEAVADAVTAAADSQAAAPPSQPRAAQATRPGGVAVPEAGRPLSAGAGGAPGQGTRTGWPGHVATGRGPGAAASIRPADRSRTEPHEAGTSCHPPGDVSAARRDSPCAMQQAFQAAVTAAPAHSGGTAAARMHSHIHPPGA